MTGLPEEDMSALLTSGMPNIYKSSLISAKIKNPQEWLSVALELEVLFRIKKPPPRFSEGDSRSATHGPGSATGGSSGSISCYNSKGERKPTKPCRHCQALGKTELHWHSECPNRSQKTFPKQIASPDSFSRESLARVPDRGS